MRSALASGLLGIFTALAATVSFEVHALSALEACADNSPTQAGVSACLDGLLVESERDLLAKAKLARKIISDIQNRERRDRARRAFERGQKLFFAERERQCGDARPEMIEDVDRANRVRDCLIRITRQRSAQIADALPPESVDELQTSRAPARVPPSRPSPGTAPQPSGDSVYGVDWRLVRLIRDNKEVQLPAGYRATLRLGGDGRVSGTGAASSFAGQFRLRTPGKIEWAQHGFLTTYVGEQSDLSQIDSLYIDSLERITRAGMSKSGLVLRNEDDSISLSFER